MESVGVMIEGSMKGLGRWGDALAGLSSTNEAHCLGSPTNLLDELSKPVCTRCWKLDGAEMSIFFFFFENIFDFKLERKFCLVLLLSPEMKLFSEEILKRFVKKFLEIFCFPIRETCQSQNF